MSDEYTPMTESVRSVYEARGWPNLDIVQMLNDEFDRWLVERDRQVARAAVFAASDEWLNGHQADRPDAASMRVGVHAWLNSYATRHWPVTEPIHLRDPKEES